MTRPLFDDTPGLSPNGLEHVPGVDTALMAKAGRALGAMSPASMPVLLDALTQRHSAENLVWAERMRDGIEIVAFLDDPLHKANAVLQDTARKVGISLPEIMTKTLEQESEFRRMRNLAEGAFHMSELGREATVNRHAYFATEDMSELIIAGANRDVRDLALTNADLPSPNGVLYLYRPGGRSVILWWATGEDNSIWATTKSELHLRTWLEADPSEDILAWHFFAMARLSEPGSDQPPSDIETHYPFEGSVNDETSTEFDRPDTKLTLPLLFSFAHMLHQEIADAAPRTSAPMPVVDRRGRKRFRKDTITYLSLRRSAGSGLKTGTARTYQHRWVVRGHWRRQWYPSEGRHKPKWITDYIAGPGEAPLLVRDKVTVINDQV